MTPDVNILIAAFRKDHVHHTKAQAWLSSALASCASGGSLEILPMVAAGFLRVVTNPKVFKTPDPPQDPHEFLSDLLAVGGAWMPELGPEWSTFTALCVEQNVMGEDIPDAWIAAAVIESDLHLVTFDRDFTRLLRPDQYTLLSGALGVSEPRPVYALPLAA